MSESGEMSADTALASAQRTAEGWRSHCRELYLRIDALEAKASPWERFLEARGALIAEWTTEGRKPEEIAATLAMDPMQVTLIAMTAAERARQRACVPE
jgi:hypothetical protein